MGSHAAERICRLTQAAANADDPRAALALLRQARVELDDFERQEVARALTEGLSFSALSGALGISRQAVHRRHRALVGPAGELAARLTPEAHLVVDYARQEAAGLGRPAASEHVLLGLLRNGDRIAAGALRDAGLTLPVARRLAGRLDGGADLPAVVAATATVAWTRRDARPGVEDLLRAAMQAPAAGATALLAGAGIAPAAVGAALVRRRATLPPRRTGAGILRDAS